MVTHNDAVWFRSRQDGEGPELEGPPAGRAAGLGRGASRALRAVAARCGTGAALGARHSSGRAGAAPTQAAPPAPLSCP